METFEKIAVLENEVQARLLDAALTDRGIPHVVQSYHSLAYDGIFQLAGWGHVEGPAEFKDEILAALEDVKGTPPVDTWEEVDE
jgi:hypothetical protein